MKDLNLLNEDSRTENAVTETNQKKTFVEPEISAAVDVLEATTFFQFGQTGSID